MLVEPIRGLATSLGPPDRREARGSEREKAGQDGQSSAGAPRNLAGIADRASDRRPPRRQEIGLPVALSASVLRRSPLMGTDQRSIRTSQRVFRRGRYGASAG